MLIILLLSLILSVSSPQATQCSLKVDDIVYKINSAVHLRVMYSEEHPLLAHKPFKIAAKFVKSVRNQPGKLDDAIENGGIQSKGIVSDVTLEKIVLPNPEDPKQQELLKLAAAKNFVDFMPIVTALDKEGRIAYYVLHPFDGLFEATNTFISLKQGLRWYETIYKSTKPLMNSLKDKQAKADKFLGKQRPESQVLEGQLSSAFIDQKNNRVFVNPFSLGTSLELIKLGTALEHPHTGQVVIAGGIPYTITKPNLGNTDFTRICRVVSPSGEVDILKYTKFGLYTPQYANERNKLQDIAETMEKLKRKDYAPIRHAEVSKDGSVLVYKELKGTTLSKYLRGKGVPRIRDISTLNNLSPEQWKLFESAALALLRRVIFTHNELHIFHGDLKSENAILDEDPNVLYLIDWQGSRKEGENSAPFAATQYTMAPEILAEVAETGKASKSLATIESDLYSVGMILVDELYLFKIIYNRYGKLPLYTLDPEKFAQATKTGREKIYDLIKATTQLDPIERMKALQDWLEHYPDF